MQGAITTIPVDDVPVERMERREDRAISCDVDRRRVLGPVVTD